MHLPELLPEAPWWAVWSLVLLTVLACCVVRVAKALLPPPQDRGQWWRDFWEYRRTRRSRAPGPAGGGAGDAGGAGGQRTGKPKE